MKKIAIILASVLLIGYIIYAVTKFESKAAESHCTEIQITIKDSASGQFILVQDVLAFLERNKIFPVGKKIPNINSEEIEQKLREIPIVDKAECYFSPGGIMHIVISQRKPILRVLSKSSDYYMDNEAKIIPGASNFSLHLPIATGSIDTLYAQDKLYKFALYLKENDFWNAQIEQIDVQPNKEVILIPKVGEHQILFGELDGFEEKLDRLMKFYQNGLRETGWNKYDKINLKFDNQIVCTKRE